MGPERFSGWRIRPLRIPSGESNCSVCVWVCAGVWVCECVSVRRLILIAATSRQPFSPLTDVKANTSTGGASWSHNSRNNTATTLQQHGNNSCNFLLLLLPPSPSFHRNQRDTSNMRSVHHFQVDFNSFQLIDSCVSVCVCVSVCQCVCLCVGVWVEYESEWSVSY